MDELPFYWYHRAKIKADAIARALHDLQGDAQDLIALIAQDPKGAEARGLSEDRARAGLAKLTDLCDDYLDASKL